MALCQVTYGNGVADRPGKARLSPSCLLHCTRAPADKGIHPHPLPCPCTPQGTPTCSRCQHALKVEQRSELVDVVTKLAKEEAAAEKGAAAAAAKAASSAAAKTDGDVGGFEVVEVLVSDAPSKGNAAAALKQVCQTIHGRPCVSYIYVASLCLIEHQCNILLVKCQIKTSKAVPVPCLQRSAGTCTCCSQ